MKCRLIDQPIDQNEIRFDVTIAVILPVSCQGVVAQFRREGAIVHEILQDDDQIGPERRLMPAALLPFEVALELRRPFNRPQRDRPSAP